ncbi:hypothetical protein HTIA_1250 [Halorhabdus tiamatea SARL4B]|uniref:Uncharacterized protein n=1 Tax=Halorhabdus tiamatea SARL4B TaxID=1033806 RepID=F7PIP5_9EURY|nr:hypothetical protein HTIA_1250 [Halorhabdus tiamatea SARL4B]
MFGPIEETSTEIAVANAALQPALDRGVEASVRLNGEQLSTAYPEHFGVFEGCCDRESEGLYHCSLDACSDPLAGLLSIETWHRFVAIESLRIDGPSWSLWYVPDHRTFELFGGEDIATAIRTAIEEQPAALLAASEHISWTQEGHRYALELPSLCVENRCYALSKLQKIDIDRETQSITLSWDDSNGLVGRVIGHLRTSPPKHLSIADTETFERVAGYFEQLRSAWE